MKPDSLELALAQHLKTGPAPEALRQRLLQSAKHSRRRAQGWSLAAAATLLLAFGASAFWFHRRQDPAPELARLALANYVQVKHLDFQGAPPQCHSCCASWPQEALGFAAPLPACVQACQVQGGRSCRIGDQPAAFYQLGANQGLYVLPKPIPHQSGAPGRTILLSASRQARIWNEGGRGYLLVEEGP